MPIVNQLTFAGRIPTASNAGGVLARWLHLAAPSRHVTLVAHSLGCRVALACVAELLHGPTIAALGGPRVTIPSVVLMAGAVRRQECERASPVFGDSYPQTYYANLYSYYDAVLATGFAAGQALVDTPGRAIGRWGEPVQGRWDDRVSTNLGHGGYWRSVEVGQCIATSMRVGRTRLLQQAPTPSAEFVQAELPVDEIDAARTFGT